MRLAKRLKSPSLIRPLALGKPLSPSPPPETGLPPSSSPPALAPTDKTQASGDNVPDSTQEDNIKLSKFVKRQLRKMSNEELEYLLSAEDNFALDCLLEALPSVSKLQRERDELLRQNTDLAKFNYAREPEFVKDRLKLREVLEDTSSLKRRLMAKHLAPILQKLDACLAALAATTCRLEDQCERLAADFLQGNKSFQSFKSAYLELRASASSKRILADKLGQQQARLVANLPKPAPTGSPVAAPRHRKRVSFNK